MYDPSRISWMRLSAHVNRREKHKFTREQLANSLHPLAQLEPSQELGEALDAWCRTHRLKASFHAWAQSAVLNALWKCLDPSQREKISVLSHHPGTRWLRVSGSMGRLACVRDLCTTPLSRQLQRWHLRARLGRNLRAASSVVGDAFAPMRAMHEWVASSMLLVPGKSYNRLHRWGQFSTMLKANRKAPRRRRPYELKPQPRCSKLLGAALPTLAPAAAGLAPEETAAPSGFIPPAPRPAGSAVALPRGSKPRKSAKRRPAACARGSG
eukprot:TRINITY_DN15545_c0_g1_i3.p1 TRINITY_DN15545_c0_g1~~TRINITY_DN15545_c0_g1_i3.p1  ORF type:complete len:268 (+),score=14.09 TRINITY_DN15545_c0_g1_i3:1197-2000(+)